MRSKISRSLLLGFFLILLWAPPVSSTWVPSQNDNPAFVIWFEKQQIMPEARARFMVQYSIGWVMCCGHADRVRVQFAVKDGNRYGIPTDDYGQPLQSAEPFLLPADTIHPTDANMPEQLAVEGVVMVVKKGVHNAPEDIVTCVWLPQPRT